MYCAGLIDACIPGIAILDYAVIVLLVFCESSIIVMSMSGLRCRYLSLPATHIIRVSTWMNQMKFGRSIKIGTNRKLCSQGIYKFVIC